MEGGQIKRLNTACAILGASRPPPGRIRPSTATGMPGSPQIYLLGANDSGKNKRQVRKRERREGQKVGSFDSCVLCSGRGHQPASFLWFQLSPLPEVGCMQALQPDPALSLTAHSIRPVSGPAGLAGGEVALPRVLFHPESLGPAGLRITLLRQRLLNLHWLLSTQDYVQLGNWEVSNTAAGFSPLPRPGLTSSPVPQQYQTSYDVESDSGYPQAGN